jgi:hypothetical protein
MMMPILENCNCFASVALPLFTDVWAINVHDKKKAMARENNIFFIAVLKELAGKLQKKDISGK